MKFGTRNSLTFTLVMAGLLCMAAGCGHSDQATPKSMPTATEPVAEGGHNLDGWWCAEHGIPEEDCSLCSVEAAKQFKEKGDWCQDHDRADSQCFICHPELEAKFAARYEAKFGKKPPKPKE